MGPLSANLSDANILEIEDIVEQFSITVVKIERIKSPMGLLLNNEDCGTTCVILPLKDRQRFQKQLYGGGWHSCCTHFMWEVLDYFVDTLFQLPPKHV